MAADVETTSELLNWLFRPNFPELWHRQPLYSLARWVNGLAFRDIQFTPTGKPVIKIAEIKNGITQQTKFTNRTFDNSVFVKSGDMLFSWSGQPETSIDAFWWRGRDGWLNQHIFKVIPNKELDPIFFFYILRYLKPNFVAIARNKQTTGLGHVTKRDLENIEAAFPPLSEQKSIAQVLGALDDKIELNRRMNETLEAMARALFQSWFVDVTQAGLPKGWRYLTIAELCDINAWTLNKTEELDRIEYVEISEVTRGNIGNIQVFPRGEEPSRARRRLRDGDTVLSTVRPERGSYFLCLNPSPNLIASTGFAVVTPTKAPWSFVHAALTNPELSEYLRQQADGGAYPAVRPEIIGKWEVPWPAKSEKVEQFHRACAPLYERAEHNRRESRTLAAVRDALLPKLLSGELRVDATRKSGTARV